MHGIGVEVAEGARVQDSPEIEHLEQVEFEVTDIALVMTHAPVPFGETDSCRMARQGPLKAITHGSLCDTINRLTIIS
ncbi:hypothetical protein GCM10027167_70500 [Nocardia heshunensis]